mmetsp:Transcript_17616/g.57433  ORF Transcript_17616/g.57433 Transcript_17616/m.57433 type:complete len:879 (+) Transcript_17616:805-3441(+)
MVVALVHDLVREEAPVLEARVEALREGPREPEPERRRPHRRARRPDLAHAPVALVCELHEEQDLRQRDQSEHPREIQLLVLVGQHHAVAGHADEARALGQAPPLRAARRVAVVGPVLVLEHVPVLALGAARAHAPHDDAAAVGALAEGRLGDVDVADGRLHGVRVLRVVDLDDDALAQVLPPAPLGRVAVHEEEGRAAAHGAQGRRGARRGLARGERRPALVDGQRHRGPLARAARAVHGRAREGDAPRELDAVGEHVGDGRGPRREVARHGPVVVRVAKGHGERRGERGVVDAVARVEGHLHGRQRVEEDDDGLRPQRLDGEALEVAELAQQHGPPAARAVAHGLVPLGADARAQQAPELGQAALLGRAEAAPGRAVLVEAAARHAAAARGHALRRFLCGRGQAVVDGDGRGDGRRAAGPRRRRGHRGRERRRRDAQKRRGHDAVVRERRRHEGPADLQSAPHGAVGDVGEVQDAQSDHGVAVQRDDDVSETHRGRLRQPPLVQRRHAQEPAVGGDGHAPGLRRRVRQVAAQERRPPQRGERRPAAARVVVPVVVVLDLRGRELDGVERVARGPAAEGRLGRLRTGERGVERAPDVARVRARERERAVEAEERVAGLAARQPLGAAHGEHGPPPLAAQRAADDDLAAAERDARVLAVLALQPPAGDVQLVERGRLVVDARDGGDPRPLGGPSREREPQGPRAVREAEEERLERLLGVDDDGLAVEREERVAGAELRAVVRRLGEHGLAAGVVEAQVEAELALPEDDVDLRVVAVDRRAARARDGPAPGRGRRRRRRRARGGRLLLGVVLRVRVVRAHRKSNVPKRREKTQKSASESKTSFRPSKKSGVCVPGEGVRSPTAGRKSPANEAAPARRAGC